MGTDDRYRPDHGDEFDDIVRGLDLNLSFPDDADDIDAGDFDAGDIDAGDLDADDLDAGGLEAGAEEPAPPVDDSELMLPGDDLSYRNPAPPPARPWSLKRIVAVSGVISGPALLILATMAGIVLPRPIAYGLALIFVACAVWLIAQLPERGPGRPDSPDDGAEL